MPFKDFIKGYQFPDGFDAQAFITAAESEYDSDFSIPVAKITELEANNAELSRDAVALKARNYDLIVKGGGATITTPNDNDNDNDDEPTITIDSLYEEKK
jgi:hypothetical protein